MRSRHEIEELEKIKVDEKIRQQLDYMKGCKLRSLAVHQLTHHLQFDLRTTESGSQTIEWDVEATIDRLKMHKRQLEQCPFTTPFTYPSKRETEAAVDAIVDGLVEAETEDLAFENASSIAEWVEPPTLKTVATCQSIADTEDTMWSAMTETNSHGDFELSEEVKAPPGLFGTFWLNPLRSKNTQGSHQWIPERQARTSTPSPSETSETSSEGERLEICNEDEIDQIVRAQAEKEATDAASERRRVQRLTPEQQKIDDLYSRLLHPKDRPSSVNRTFKLPPGPQPTTKEDFLRNLGRETTPSHPEVAAERTQTQQRETRDDRSSPEPVAICATPSTESSTVRSSPPVASTTPGIGSFEAGGFSAFGMPSQMGSSLSLGHQPFGGSMQSSTGTSSTIGSGFGAFARSQNVFGAMAHAQGSQGGNAFSAMAAMAGNPTPAFSGNRMQGNSKLYEMRK